jgi:hypothetical protein
MLCLLAATGLALALPAGAAPAADEGPMPVLRMPKPIDGPRPPPPTPEQIAAREKQAAEDSKTWNENPGPKDPRDFSGVWWATRYIRDYRQLDGTMPPLTRKGIEAANYRGEMLDKGTPVADASTQCFPNGVPRVMTSPYPLQFFYSPGLITMLIEVGHGVRQIHMDGKPPPPNTPHTFNGYSVGHWEGDTLVVETTHRNARTVIDQTNLSHGDKLKVTERFTKFTDKYGGMNIRDVMTIEDPEYYTRPWQTERIFNWRGDVKLMEYVCEENNREAADDEGKAGAQ